MNKSMKLAIAIIVTILVSACATPNQLYWDHKVKELCEKDGGVTVFEKIALTKDEYEQNDGKNGTIRVPPEKSPANSTKYQFYKKSNDIVLNETKPRVVRYQYDVYRKSDNKLLGTMVSYSRSGGDILVIDAGSSFTCADMKTIPLDVEKQIFSYKE